MEKKTPGNTRVIFLDGLTPNTYYEVSVSAVYFLGEGEASVAGVTTACKLL